MKFRILEKANLPLSVEPLTVDPWIVLTEQLYISETASCCSRFRQRSKYSSYVTGRMFVVDIQSVYLSVLFRLYN